MTLAMWSGHLVIFWRDHPSPLKGSLKDDEDMMLMMKDLRFALLSLLSLTKQPDFSLNNRIWSRPSLCIDSLTLNYCKWDQINNCRIISHIRARRESSAVLTQHRITWWEWRQWKIPLDGRIKMQEKKIRLMIDEMPADIKHSEAKQYCPFYTKYF